MARLESVGRLIEVAAQSTLEETHKHFVAVAKSEHGKIMTAAPRPTSFARYVDGAAGLPEEAVKANGRIVYTYGRIDEVAQFALEVLFDLSPVKSGAYRNGHSLFMDGVAVANLAAWEPGAEVSISNALPYARKIEVGAMKMRVGGGDQVYKRARAKVMARYGNLADVQFTFRAIVGGGQVNQQAMPAAGKPISDKPWLAGGESRGGAARSRGKNGRFVSGGLSQPHNSSDLRFPTLIIKER